LCDASRKARRTVTWTLEALDGDSTLLTVNNRLAAELRARYDRLRAGGGRRVWPSADILPWSAWLQRHYARLLDNGFTELDLLSTDQERLLWQETVESDQGLDGLLRPAAAAESARAAYALLHDWHLERYPLATLGGEETTTFLRWRAAFDAATRQRGLLSAARLPALLLAAFEQGALETPARLVHSGFDSPSPAQQSLFQRLEDSGCEIVAYQDRPCQSTRQRVEANDDEEEIRLAARWARDRLGDERPASIGIVSAQVSQQRRDLERIFSEIVTPTAYLGRRNRPSLFNISLGEALSDSPLVAHALLALDLLRGEQPLHAIGQLLRSPFIGGHSTEWDARALLDAALRRDGLPRIDLRRLHYRVSHFDPGDPCHCPDLAARLEDFLNRRKGLPAGDSPSHWAGHLQALLASLGWPGDHALDSREYQQRERLQRLFSELAALGKIRPQMRLGEVIGQLRTLAKDTVFQAESVPAPIQILGPLEAAGMAFDALWLLGMHGQAWPPAPHPDPLLPTQLQRELGMPHASAARELEFAGALVERLAGSAPLVIASHARSAGEREQRASPLVQDWPVLDAARVASPSEDGSLRTACARVDRREPLPTAQAGGAPIGARGGAALLGAQANCPFQAVARFRLEARPLEEARFSVDAALAGNLVHELLQRVWQSLGDSTALAGLDEAAVHALVEPLAAQTLADLGRRRPDLFTTRFRAIETARLTRLVGDWLALERSRSLPFAVAALEQDQTIELEGLRLSTRADRVDRLADGSLAIIDYKTGQTVSNDGWFDERLSEPQLPLYCLRGGDDVSAALLARVRRDDRGCRFVGLSRDAGFAPGIGSPREGEREVDWHELLEHWRRALERLAREIASGRADPTPSPQACQFCPFGALCRVQEMLAGYDGG
jgi:ATP-dependent helicase/nuclease subunit B